MPAHDKWGARSGIELWYPEIGEKYIEDAKQDEKHVLDLLESITQPPDPVKDELRQKLFKIMHFGSKINKIRVSKFWIPEIQRFPAGGQHNLLAQ